MTTDVSRLRRQHFISEIQNNEVSNCFENSRKYPSQEDDDIFIYLIFQIKIKFLTQLHSTYLLGIVVFLDGIFGFQV